MADLGITRDGGQAKVALPRELTASEVPLYQPALKQEVDGDAREIVFDMSETESLDCAGICLLLAAYNSMQEVGGTVRLIGLSDDIYKMLQGMKLADRLNAASASGEGSNG